MALNKFILPFLFQPIMILITENYIYLVKFVMLCDPPFYSIYFCC